MSNVTNVDDFVKTALTETEQVEAQKHEKIVEEGLAGYVAIGDALGTIRDQHLFVGPFRSYVVERFEIDYPTANRRIVAARVALNLKAAGLTIPLHQDQAYHLHDLEDEKQIETWQKVLDRAKSKKARITTNLIREVMGEKKPQPSTTKNGNSKSQPRTASSTPKPDSPMLSSHENPVAPSTPASETVEKAMPAPKPESAPTGQNHENPVAGATQSVGKAVAALQHAYAMLDGAEIVAYEELDAKLSELTALVNGIRGLLPKKATEPLKLVG